MKKLPSQYSTDELMNLLESLDETPEKDEEAVLGQKAGDIASFTSNYNITPGTTAVTKNLLYKLYKAYVNDGMSKTEFTSKMKEYVDDKNTAYFYINKDQFAISTFIYKEVEKRDHTKSISFQKHFDWFVSNSGLTTGTKWVEGFILYYIYRDFCKGRKVHPKIGYKSFHNFLKLHFKYKRLSENRALWFQVNEEIHNLLTEEEKGIIRDTRKKTRRS